MLELKVTGTPEQILVVEVLMDMVGTVGAVTVIEIAFEVAFADEVQLALEVSTHVTTSPFAKALFE